MAIIKVGDKATVPSARPVLNLDFANSKMLPADMTFSRNSTATWWNAKDEILTNHNLLKDSNDPSATTWSKYGWGAETDANLVFPDGTVGGPILKEVASAANYHQMEQYPTTFRSRRVVYSLYAKNVSGYENGNRYLVLGGNCGSVGSTQYVAVIFDITNGNVMATRDEGSQTHVASGSVSIGDGWYRLYVIADITADASMLVSGSNSSTFNVNNYARASAYTEDTNVKVAIWGCQAEDGGDLTAMIPTGDLAIRRTGPKLETASANTPRFDYNPETKESRGLLFEQGSTNLWSDSIRQWNEYLKPSDTLDWAPDGTVSARHFHQTTSGSGYWYWSSSVTATDIAPSATSNMTTSFFIKIYKTVTTISVGWPSSFGKVSIYKNDDTYSGGDLTLSSAGGASNIRANYVGNGWYRVAFESTPPNGNLEFQVDTNSETHARFSLWGFQTEITNGVETSFIKTTGTQLTRVADQVNVQNFNNTWNAAAPWTIVAEREVICAGQLSNNGYIAQLSGNGFNGFLLLRSSGGTDLGVAVRDYSGYNGSIGTSSSAIHAKYSVSYDPGQGMIGAVGGTSLTADTGVYVQGDWSTLNLGGTGSSAERVNGWIRRVVFYQHASSQDEVNVLSED